MNIQTCELLKAIADPTRLRILSLISSLPDICVCQIMEVMQLPQTTVSKALGVLKKVGLVADRRDGHWVRYRVMPPDKGFPLRDILQRTSSDAPMCDDLAQLRKIKRLSLDALCCDKPWRK